ncbi:ABC transporter substrate-binding protein [Neopusillimonas maritima]|uniref:Branched-chain amino acid ABC transporter substrate-binding protein n=1 Tax=Neopusillimonas maritima TaxID=2026239 RepID=A0A3A1YS70_9BURK|nr:ABC transporter substrate-binding protein [Neopusillimonas maritima]RIY38867.1 branched-chain amino acid ABC transporter substrate-binding protein [Neopusillimonas maritima]
MKKHLFALALATLLPFGVYANVKVGVILSSTGPGASLGIPQKNMFAILPHTLGGEPVEYIIVDDATDATTAVKMARKLIVQDKVDLIIGSSVVPMSISVAGIAQELETPQIALAPTSITPDKNLWTFSVPQPINIMMGAVVAHMIEHDVKTVGYLGFADAWGEMVSAGLQHNMDREGIKLVASERYGRVDTSVSGQVLKLIAAKPDAIVLGGSGTPGALPQGELVKRGYKGPIYHNHGVINKDFLRVGGKSLEGAYAPTGPVMVAEQLSDSNPIKKVALEFTKTYEDEYGEGSRNAFAAYAWDAYLLADQAIAAAVKNAKPGAPEFRATLRDALENAKEVVGTHGVYNMTPTDHTGLDQRASTLVQVKDGQWKLVK